MQANLTEDAAFEFSHYELDGTLIINLWAHTLLTRVPVCVCVCVCVRVRVGVTKCA